MKLTKFQRRVLVSIRDTGHLPPTWRKCYPRPASIDAMQRAGWIEKVWHNGPPATYTWRLTKIGGPLLLTL